MPGGLPVRGQLLEAVSKYDMDAEGICACVFVFQEALSNYKELYSFCYEKLEEYAEILYMPEQAIFDFMLQEFGLVDETWSCARCEVKFEPSAKALFDRAGQTFCTDAKVCAGRSEARNKGRSYGRNRYRPVE